MKVLVINSGSSSVKYEVFEASDLSIRSSGLLERIGETESRHTHKAYGPSRTVKETVRRGRVENHREGFGFILSMPADSSVIKNPAELLGIGHRVVHGGEAFREPVLIDEKVMKTIRELIPLAPLHNPANLVGIEAAQQVFQGVPQVAVFDTAFHQTLPPHAFHYAVPYEWYTKFHVRRYGFHGTSHLYVSREAARYLGKAPESMNLITLHLGNGASCAAVRGGLSIDTSMGLTPLEGLVMGTRSGDIDPALHFFIMRETGISTDELEKSLNSQGGLKGVCGLNDMREIQQQAEAGIERALLALDMFCYRIRKYIGAYWAVLGRVDAIVFTGGIGENSVIVRRRVCSGLEHMGISLDEKRNMAVSGNVAEIQTNRAPVKVLVVKTDEEREIARQTMRVILNAGLEHPARSANGRPDSRYPKGGD